MDLAPAQSSISTGLALQTTMWLSRRRTPRPCARPPRASAGSGAELYDVERRRAFAILRDQRAHLAHLLDRQISLEVGRYGRDAIVLCCAAKWARPWPRCCDRDWNSLLYRRRKEARGLERVMLPLVGSVFTAHQGGQNREALVQLFRLAGHRSPADRRLSARRTNRRLLRFPRMRRPFDKWSRATASRATFQGERRGSGITIGPNWMRRVASAIATSVTVVSATGTAPGAMMWSHIKKASQP